MTQVPLRREVSEIRKGDYIVVKGKTCLVTGRRFCAGKDAAPYGVTECYLFQTDQGEVLTGTEGWLAIPGLYEDAETTAN